MAMHAYKVKMKEGYLFSKRNQVVGPTSNNTTFLGHSMQTFLLSSVYRNQSEFNIHNKPVKNMNGNELCNFLMEAINELFISGFDLVATIFDGGATNRKCIRLLVDSTTNK